MGVGIHETRENGHLAEVDLCRSVSRNGPVTDRNDPTALDQNPAVPDRPAGDRKNPGRVVTNHGRITLRRACAL
jgi:hypothetical protein